MTDKYQVNVPAQVAARAREADELMARALGQTDGDTDPAENADGATVQPAGDGPAPADSDRETRNEEQDPAQYWENRFRTAEGMFKAEKNRLHSRINELEDMLRQTQEQRQAAAENSDTAAAPNPEALEEAYGPEIAELARQNRLLLDELNTLKGNVQQVQSVTQKSAVSAFEDEMDRQVPAWRRLNEDQDFIAWLHDNGLARNISRAGESLDAEGAARIMRLYIKDTGFRDDGSSERTTPAASSTPPAGQQAPRERTFTPPPVEQQVQPRTSGQGQPSDHSAPLYSTAQIQEFYTKKAAGRFPFWAGSLAVNSEQEAVAIDNDMTLAAMQGRISG